MITRQRVDALLGPRAGGSRAGQLIGFAIVALIVLNVAAMMLETVASIGSAHHGLFVWFERFSVAVFSLEYVARLWSCTAREEYRGRVLGRLRLAATPMMLVDLLAILPFYLPVLGLDLRFLRTLRLARIARIVKLGRYSQSLQTLGRVLASKTYELGMTLFVLVLLLVVSSSVLYYAEHGTQPDKFSSIPASLWWAVATLTTVGYGDIYPVTALGKLCSSIVAIIGIGMCALPAGILSAGFVEEMKRGQSSPDEQPSGSAGGKCPHCGRELR